jgi:predicted RNase H-like HicB family nuclease
MTTIKIILMTHLKEVPMLKDFTVLIEEDYASNNVSIYLPELRLSVVGDTEEEALICAKDLIAIECEKKQNLKSYKTKIISVQVDVSLDSNNQNLSVVS